MVGLCLVSEQLLRFCLICGSRLFELFIADGADGPKDVLAEAEAVQLEDIDLPRVGWMSFLMLVMDFPQKIRLSLFQVQISLVLFCCSSPGDSDSELRDHRHGFRNRPKVSLGR